MSDEENGHPPAAPLPLARAIIIEDDPDLRRYAATVLSGAAEIMLVGEGATLAEGLELAACAPDLVLLDLGLPDGSGVAVIEAVRALNPAAKVLVFTVFEDRVSVVGTLRAGADGYILKDTSPDMLLAHIRSTLAGEAPVSARAASHLLSLVREDPEPADNGPDVQAESDAPHLSPRERELLEYLARGLARKEAARLMDISPYTVAEYMQSIYRKLQVRSRGEAVFEAMRTKLIRLGHD